MKINGIKLDIKKVLQILDTIDRNASWLARQSGVSRALVSYDLKSGCPNRAANYAAALGVFEPEKLLIIQ